MLAARLYGKEDIIIEDVATPEVGHHELRLAVKSSFICGTDVRMYKNGHPNARADSPLILGHELSGVIDQVGKNVSHYKEGMRVSVAPNMGCGVCDLCVSGNTHLCPNYKALGISLDGGFAEKVKIPESMIRQGNILELQESISFKEASLAEPLSCVYNAFERCDIRAGDAVLIIGSGPIGIMHAKLAMAGGAGKVFINDLNEQRLELCKTFDNRFITLAGADIQERVFNETHGKGVDVCITACPAPAAQENSLALMAVNGRVNFFGGLPKGLKVSLDTNLIHYKQIIVSGTTRASMFQFRKTLQLISERVITVNDLISESFSLSRFPQALENAIKGLGLKNEVAFV